MFLICTKGEYLQFQMAKCNVYFILSVNENLAFQRLIFIFLSNSIVIFLLKYLIKSCLNKELRYNEGDISCSTERKRIFFHSMHLD